jgi:hypothetical protein
LGRADAIQSLVAANDEKHARKIARRNRLCGYDVGWMKCEAKDVTGAWYGAQS